MRSRSSRAPIVTAPPAIAADRLPPVPAMLNGVTAVSPKRTRTCSIVTPTSSAATWARVVSWPWPCGICWVTTVTTPSSSSTTRTGSPPTAAPTAPPPITAAAKSGGPGAASMKVATPSPRWRPPARAAAWCAGHASNSAAVSALLERRARRHAHVQRGTGDHPGRELRRRHHVAQPDLVAPDPELTGCDVEHALAHPGLDRPGAAVRAVRGLVRRGDGGVEAVGGHAVRARHHDADDAREHRGTDREPAVRALVEREVRAEPEQRAVAR